VTIPSEWLRAELAEVCEIFMGQSPSSNAINTEGKGLPFFQGKSEFQDVFPENRRFCESPLRIAEKNDVLMSVRAPVGPVNIARETSGFGRGLCAIRAEKGIDYKYVFFQLRSMESYISSLGTGSTFTAINRKDVESLSVAIAPEKEQVRIVEKLEELFSDLDNGVAELKAAQTKLTQYRQSLLKSAVEGTLTQQWRETHKPKETGTQLLERILIERRQRWEEQKLKEFKEKDKKPPKDWQKKYKEPVKPETSELPELPDGWVWTSLDMLGDIVSGITKGNKRKGEVTTREVPYLRVANVQRGYLDLSVIKTIEATEDEIRKFTLEIGDILFNEGGDRDKLGRGWVWYGEVENCIHQNHVFRMRPYLKELVPELISHHGNTFGQQWFQSAGKQTTNLASINMGILKRFPVPLAPAEEQVILFDQLNMELSNIDAQIKNVASGLKQTDAQRKNILKSAFSGELVNQDPKDEPASVLLERIKEEREVLAKQAKPKRVKKKSSEAEKIMDTLREVLLAEDDWIDSQEAFRRCGVTDGTDSDRIEELYAELRRLDKAKILDTKRIGDHDQLKLKSNS